MDDLRANIIRAQQCMRSNADAHCRDECFESGDKVWLKLQPYRQRSLAKCPCEKLVDRYYGPFEVLEKVGTMAYHLALSTHNLIHPVFHVSQLKRAMGVIEEIQTIPHQLI